VTDLQRWEAIATIAGNVTILIALVIALFQIRSLKIDRTANLAVELRRWLEDLDPQWLRLVAVGREGRTIDLAAADNPDTIAFRVVGNFLELVAALVSLNVLDRRIVGAAFGRGMFEGFYERFKPQIEKLREDDKRVYKWLVGFVQDP